MVSTEFLEHETLQPVSAADLRAVWASIRDRVAKIADKCGEPWIAEDVFHELLVGNSHLWATPDASGFVVLRIFATNYRRTLFVWLADKGSMTALNGTMLEQLKGIAEANECAAVEWESPRPWDEILPEAKRSYKYVVDVGG